MTTPKHQKEKVKRLRHLEVTPVGGGFQVTHHNEPAERGTYEEPKTHIMKTHGHLMHHLHEHLGSLGYKGKAKEVSEKECPICDKEEAKEGED
jgi:hypothetical protein